MVIEREQFFDDYYEPFLNLLGDRRGEGGAAEVSVRIPELDIAIGIETKTYELVRRRAYQELVRYVSDFPIREGTSRHKTGRDGVVVELGSSWFSADGSLVLPARK